jgi:UDP-N-acetylglucosamine acyltransferase
MIVGLSGIRADVIPWGMAQGPLAFMAGLNVVGLRRRGFVKAEIHRLRVAFRELFFGSGEFRERLAATETRFAGDRLIDSVIAFIRGGTRPLTMAARRAAACGPDEE